MQPAFLFSLLSLLLLLLLIFHQLLLLFVCLGLLAYDSLSSSSSSFSSHLLCRCGSIFGASKVVSVYDRKEQKKTQINLKNFKFVNRRWKCTENGLNPKIVKCLLCGKWTRTAIERIDWCFLNIYVYDSFVVFHSHIMECVDAILLCPQFYCCRRSVPFSIELWLAFDYCVLFFDD